MKVSTEKLANCQVALNIEAEASELDKSLDEAYRYLVSKLSIPGFRKGKAPRAVLVQHIGKEGLVDEALERLIPPLYKQAIESEKLEPIAAPQIEVVQREPVIFKAIVPLKPEVELGDYHSLKLERGPAIEIADKELTDAMDEIRERQGAWVPVDRPVELTDLVTMDIQADVDGKPWLDHKGVVYEVREDSRTPVAGFASRVPGAEKGKQISFSLTIPDDYPLKEMRGKEGAFRVTVSEIKQKQLPELNDELATSAGYANLEDMRKKAVDDLTAKAEARKEMELKQKALDALVGMSKVDYAPVVEDEEIEGLLGREAQRLGFGDTADYLKRTNRTEQEMKEELRPIARRRLIEGLILGKLAEQEKIEISASEVDNKVDEIVNDAEDKERARQLFSLPQFKQSIQDSLRTKRTLDRLVQIATGNATNMTKGE
jgi:trigger factor